MTGHRTQPTSARRDHQVYIWGGNGYFKNCTFSGNKASDHGGAIDFSYVKLDSSFKPVPSCSGSTVENCIFTDNVATTWGGAINIHFGCRCVIGAWMQKHT